jgi:hypothetical protein
MLEWIKGLFKRSSKAIEVPVMVQREASCSSTRKRDQEIINKELMERMAQYEAEQQEQWERDRREVIQAWRENNRQLEAWNAKHREGKQRDGLRLVA